MHTRLMVYAHGTCPLCDQGLLGFVRCGGSDRVVVSCDECGGVWLDAEHIDCDHALTPEGPRRDVVAAGGCSLAPPAARWATNDEISGAGWARHIAGTYEQHYWQGARRHFEARDKLLAARDVAHEPRDEWADRLREQAWRIFARHDPIRFGPELTDREYAPEVEEVLRELSPQVTAQQLRSAVIQAFELYFGQHLVRPTLDRARGDAYDAIVRELLEACASARDAPR